MSRPGGEAARDILSGSHRRQTLLQEVFAQDYNVTEEEVAEYCEKLGINAVEEPQLVSLARAALLHPLPSNWTPVEDPQQGLYFFNRLTGESRWSHPIDTIVRALIAGERSKTPCAAIDSSTEEFDAEELQISEYLKTHVSDDKLAHEDSETNLPSEHTTDAFTLTSQCLKAVDKFALRPPKTANRLSSAGNNLEGRQDSRSHSEDVKEDVKCRDKNGPPSEPLGKPEGNVHVNSKTEEDICGNVHGPNHDKERRIASSIDKTSGREWECINGNVTPPSDANLKAEEEASRQQTDHIEQDQSVSGPQLYSTAPTRARDPAMFTGRDDPGRGLARAPLGAPSSLAAPPPLGRPPLGAPPLGGARVPPIGGQLTPLAPIAAASRGGPPHLAPLKPIGSSGQPPAPASTERWAPLPLKRPGTQEQQGRGSGWHEEQQPGQRKGGEARGQGDGTDLGLSSPPKSILKGPVLARGMTARGQPQGMDRMQLLQPKETKNIRFDFKTDDLEFHTSEEEYDEDLDEEEEEEVEEEYDGEEEYDSEAEDPEEEEMLKARVQDKEGGVAGLMLQDASHLMASISAPLALKQQPALPHGPDPWATDRPEKPKPEEKAYDPLQNFRKEKEDVGERATQKQPETKPLKAPAKQQPHQTQSVEVAQNRPKPVDTQASKRTGDTNKLGSNDQAAQSQQKKSNSSISSENKGPQNTPPATQNSQLLGGKSQDAKTSDHKQQEDRKLELEGAPKSRKVNPLDRVVAKLSGKTEERSGAEGGGVEGKNSLQDDNDDFEEFSHKAVVKNVTVNLTELMTKEELSEDDDSSANDDNDPHPKIQINQERLRQESQALARQREEEVRKLQHHHETQLKALKEQLNKEYHDLEEKLRSEHNIALNKLKEQEKKKLEASQNQLLRRVEEDNKKSLNETKARFEKEHAERKKKLLEEVEKKNEEDLEQMKVEFVREMQLSKEELLKEHEEEMQDLEEDLKELYAQQKAEKQKELDLAQAASAPKNTSDSTAITAAVSQLELSMEEVLRQRQAQIRREHSRQLATLEEKLDEELEKAASQAKEKETLEKRNHSNRLIALRDEQEQELAELEECHARQLQDLEAKHNLDVAKLKSEFKAELMRQKTELENKLTEFRIEYEQKMDNIGQEEEREEEEEKEEEDGPDEDREDSVERSLERNEERNQNNNEKYIGKTKNNLHEDGASLSQGVARGKERLQDEEKKYDEILKELQERRKSLENDLEELKVQENKVKELKSHHLANSHSHSSRSMCIHETKYTKMKAKYSSLVSRIKSQKAKKSLRPTPATHNTMSVSSDKCSMESSASACDSGQPSPDPSLSTTSSSPRYAMLHKTRQYHSTTSEASEDEEVRFAAEVLEKYKKVANHRNKGGLQNDHLRHQVTTPFSSIPKKAWVEDELLAHGRKELNRAEKLLKSLDIKNRQEVRNITAEDVHREILQQNVDYSILKPKIGLVNPPVAPGGSLSSDAESDEPTHDVPSPASDFGLDRMLEQISSANMKVRSYPHKHSSRERYHVPRARGSLEFDFNNITDPYKTYSSGCHTVSSAGPIHLEHLTSGSVPDLGPETIDRIASVNHYLQQRWTSYFGELSVPLRGKVGWPAQVIGQSTLLASKNTTPSSVNIPEKQEKDSFCVADRDGQKSHENVKNVSEKIDDLRAWLQEAQATSVSFYDK